MIYNNDYKKNLNDINSFNNSINNIREKIQYFKEKNNKTEKKYKKYKTLSRIIKSIETFVILATTSSSITLSLTEIGLIVIPILTATACGFSIGNKGIYEIIINKYIHYKKQYERDQQTIKSFDTLCRKTLQYNVIDNSEYESLCNNFTKYLEETKSESFLKL